MRSCSLKVWIHVFALSAVLGSMAGPDITEMDARQLARQSHVAGQVRSADETVKVLYEALAITQIAWLSPDQLAQFEFADNPAITPDAFSADYAVTRYAPFKSATEEDFEITPVGSVAFPWNNVSSISAYVVDRKKFFGLYDESRFVAELQLTDCERDGIVARNNRFLLCARKGYLPNLVWALYRLTGRPLPVQLTVQEEEVMQPDPAGQELPAPVMGQAETESVSGTSQTPNPQISGQTVSETKRQPSTRDEEHCLEQLRRLRALYEQGLITLNVYEERQRKILDRMAE